MKTIDCYILGGIANETASNLKKQHCVSSVTIIPEGENFCSTGVLRRIAGQSQAEYILLYIKTTELSLVAYALERMIAVAEDSAAAMVYADRFIYAGNELKNAPVIDCQAGALRDDFDFGGLLLFRNDAFKEAVADMDCDYRYAALYDLRLKISRKSAPVHINEYAMEQCTTVEDDRLEQLLEEADQWAQSLQQED